MGFIFLLSCTNSYALTGNELHGWLKSDNSRDNLAANYYIMGAIDAQEAFLSVERGLAKSHKRKPLESMFFCQPSGSFYGQAYDIVENYLKNFPEKRHQSAFIIVQNSLLEVWRCSDN